MPSSFLRTAIITMVVIGFCASVYACGSATDATKGDTKLEKLATGSMAGMDFAFQGQPAPTDEFVGPDGNTVTLEDFQGKAVLVNIWATWCAPCEKEMPSLAALQTARGGEDFKVVAISIDELSEREFVQGQLKSLTGGALDFYQSKDFIITNSLGIVGFPTSIIYGADGLEIARLAGDTDWANYEAIGFIDEVIRQN